MNPRPFSDNKEKPQEARLKEVLGSAYGFYGEIEKLTSEYLHEWNYSKSSGWMEKVHKASKALFYLIPLEKELSISLTLRESERETLLTEPEMEAYHAELGTAKKYSEGFLMRFEITLEPSFENFKRFITRLMKIRR